MLPLSASDSDGVHLPSSSFMTSSMSFAPSAPSPRATPNAQPSRDAESRRGRSDAMAWKSADDVT
eukprot:CAMPEP_0182470170 /NCGR_PEP_ID=MMETSP1319-20130603/18290_1 /TAXON_ID=172717 /ORGANISM="Bolidomonas pacifica, Strain RCC208" /LENGTH=64 /DNA_ID=CAMNT_0024670577 /DNA_START=52 /DNA_END=246 /DNA_ORIENTATION=+